MAVEDKVLHASSHFAAKLTQKTVGQHKGIKILNEKLAGFLAAA